MHLLNEKAVRQLLLDTAKQLRPFNKFKRVSQATLDAANESVRHWCVNRIRQTPSKGKTI